MLLSASESAFSLPTFMFLSCVLVSSHGLGGLIPKQRSSRRLADSSVGRLSKVALTVGQLRKYMQRVDAAVANSVWERCGRSVGLAFAHSSSNISEESNRFLQALVEFGR